MSAAYPEKRSYFEPNVCRLCSFSRDKVLPIFDTSGSKFDAKIRDCLHCLNITPGDGKPQQICLECITKLNIYYEFLQLCMRSDSYFEAYIKAHKMKEQSEKVVHHPAVNEFTPNSDNVPSDGMIVLSKLDHSMPDSLRDLVVVVELKYKDGNQPTGGESHSLQGSSSGPEGGERSAEKAVECILNNKTSGTIQSQHFQQNSPTATKPAEFQIPTSLYDPANKEFECAMCDKKFKKRTRLNAHLACHTDYRPHSCDQCGKSFAMKWDLNIHLRVHNRDIVCSRCDKAFATKSKLERHIRVHTGEKPFSCGYCDKNFGDKRNLDNHLRSHTGVKPYSCSVCKKTFAVQSHMVEHLNVHKKTSTYSCLICEKVFRWRANYRKHMKSHSSSENG